MGLRNEGEAFEMKIVENSKKIFLASLVVLLVGVGAMAYHGNAGEGLLNWDVEFTGGVSLEIDMVDDYDNGTLEQIVKDVTDQHAPRIQQVIGSNMAILKLQEIDGATTNALMAEIKKEYPAATLLSTATVSGTVSKEMQRTAVKATLIACVAMLIYISIRFRDVRMGASAIAALAHDLMVIIATYALLRIPVNNTFIAVLLTIMGYSINATIVIFDRIRENKDSFKPYEMKERINKSVSQTLARSINTSLTTFLAIAAVYFIGVSSIKEFALPIMVGIVAGAYSSICISGSVWYALLPKSMK